MGDRGNPSRVVQKCSPDGKAEIIIKSNLVVIMWKRNAQKNRGNFSAKFHSGVLLTLLARKETVQIFSSSGEKAKMPYWKGSRHSVG